MKNSYKLAKSLFPENLISKHWDIYPSNFHEVLFNKKKIDESKKLLVNIINESHKFYSPLALYFIIDNNLEADRLKILDFFDIILSINSIDKENLNLIKIKKAVFLLNSGDEDAIIKILNPIVNSDSVWRNMAIKLGQS